MPFNPLIEHDQIINSLRSALSEGKHGLASFPGLLKRVLSEDIWRERVVARTGEVARFNRFEQFVTTAPLEGLGATMELVKSIVRDDPETLDLLDKEINKGQGERKELHDNVMKSTQGNDRQYALRKLRKDKPELHVKVLAGELSAHAAMVKAGFRKKTTPLQDAQRLWGKMSQDEKRSFKAWLLSQS